MTTQEGIIKALNILLERGWRPIEGTWEIKESYASYKGSIRLTSEAIYKAIQSISEMNIVQRHMTYEVLLGLSPADIREACDIIKSHGGEVTDIFFESPGSIGICYQCYVDYTIENDETTNEREANNITPQGR